MLDDLLAPGLRVVICGTALGPKSAAVGAYYAGPNNKFWSTLAVVGLTPKMLQPQEYCSLLTHGIGLTDIAKGVAGVDSSLPPGVWNVPGLRRKISSYQPRFLCFNGMQAAKVFFDEKKVALGLRSETLGRTRVFIAPSTSGAANGFWDIEKWRELARLVEEGA